jgi:hypothetical protein
MTTPANQPPQRVLPGCTDYSPYSLDELWAMISQPDTLSQTQIDGWLNMAILCQDQADTLTRALASLADHWPPTQGSASAAFTTMFQGLVASMTEDASAAQKMSGTLSDIVGTLATAKNRMQPLMDQQTHFGHMESATRNPNIAAARLAPHAPDGWQADLHQQATSIMASTDARIDALAATMPTFVALMVNVPGRDDGNQSLSQAAGGSLTRVPESLRPGSPSAASSLLPGTIGLVGSPRDPTPAGSRVASAPVDTMLQGEPVLEPLTAAPDDPKVYNSGPVAAIAAPMGNNSSSSESLGSTTTALPYGEADAGGRGANAGSLMVPPGVGGGRPPSITGQRPIRPGGRAALWSSQRKRQDHGRNDPWSVPKGVPAVLEPSPEPVDHDPGPGVIGLDR